MTDDDLPRRIDAARVRAGLTVQDLWLRYLAMGGSCDAFDIDGFLQCLVTLDPFRTSVLTQTVNEALEDSYASCSIPLPSHARDGPTEDDLRKAVQQMLTGLADRDASNPPDGSSRADPG